MFKNTQISQLLQQIPNVIPSYCDKCGAKHNKEDVEIIAQDLDKMALRLTCTNCNTNYMIQVQSPSEGVLSAKKTSSRTDINSAEIRKFTEFDAINNEEILDVHMAMKGVNNLKDFELLFAEQDNS